ncbi:WXG100 family type VII secretion target [Phycisphaerales bacterium AB-hyl4]|uniref:WXG100 family type VII secretion target n=1 Tax=Natronomicrosphaera hydrolytica TaxID=3242702 RepID=A0ABV4U8Q7_9BACT
MARASVDPEELRRFARDLTRFNAQLEEMMGALSARTHQLAESWRDAEHRKFVEEMARTSKALGQFVQMSNEHAAFLVKKAGHVDAYLNQR